MPESYSVKAVLSAVDNNFSSTVKNAIESVGGITKKTGVFGKSASSSFKQASDSATGFGSSVARLSTAIGITKAVSAGINAMKNSMGGAVSRMDTLANSSRVFKNMGFAAGDTAKMMEQLQVSIKGLPTPLDQAVKGVQMIASSTGDIGKSQAIWAALNDSILGFGGSTADVNNAVLQLSQAFSNGTIDGMTWISMMNSQMGPVLTAIAKKMGITTGELKEGLSKGKISVQEFQDALIELDKNGGGGLESLHNIALTATGGIATSMQNAKTSVTRGLTEMLKGFDTFTQTVTGLNLSQIINQIGTAVEGVLDKVASNIPKAAGYFKKLGLTADQSKGLITGFVSAAMGIGAIIAVTPVIGSVISALGGLFKAVVQVKDIFISLSSFLISPWGLATVAIGLVVAALVELYAKFQPLHDAVNGTVSAFTQGFGQAIPQMLGYLNQMFQNLQTQLGLIGTAIQQQIGGSLHAINVQSFADDFSSAFGDLIGIINTFVNAITQVIVGFIQVGTLQSVWTAIGAVINAVQTIIFTVVNEIGQFITNSSGVEGTGSGWQIVGNAIGTVVNWIAQAITAVANFISQSTGGLSQVIQFIQGVINAVVQMVAGFVNTGAIQTVWQAIGSVIQAVQSVIESVSGAVTNFTNNSTMAGSTTNIWSMIGEAIGTVVNWIAQAITAVSNFVTQSSEGIGQVVNFIMQVIDAIGQMVQSFINTGAVQEVWIALQAVIGAITGVIGGIINAIGNLIGVSANVNSTQNIWQTLGTVIGNIVGVIANMVTQLSNFINYISGMSDFMTPLVGSVAAFVGAFKGISIVIGLINALKKALIFTEVVTAVSGDMNLLKFALSNMANESKLAAAAQAILNGVMAINPFVLIAAAIAAVVTALTLFFTKTQTGQQLWQQFATFISGLWNGIVSTAQTVFGGLASFFSGLWSGITSTATSIWNGITDTLSEIWNGIVSAATPIFQGLSNFLSGLWQGISSVAKGAWELIKSVIMGPVLILIDLVTGDFKHLQSDLSLIWNSIKSAGSSIWNGLKTIFTTVTTAIKDTVVGIWNGAKGLIVGIWNALKSAGQNIVNGIKSFFTKGFTNTKNSVVNIAKTMTKGAQDAWNGIVSAAKWVVNTAKDVFNNLRHINLLDIGKSIINGFLKGMKSAFEGVKDWIGGIGDWIRKHKGPIQYDRKLLIPAGNAIMEGLNSGLVSSFKDVQNNVSSMAKAIAQSANSNFSKNINAFNANLTSGTVSHAISGSLDVTKQPMSLNLVMGDNTYGAYVDDITKQQDINLSLSRF